MTDLETREKKRNLPPPKLRPIKVEQLKEKEAYLADYFGEASVPFATTTIRPPKRPVYLKPKSKGTNASIANTATNINNDVPPENDHVNQENQPAVILEQGPRSSVVLEQPSTKETHKPSPLSTDPTNSAAVTDTTPLQRLRSSSRLAQQDSLHRLRRLSVSDQEKPGLEEASASPAEVRPLFVVPQPKFKSPPGKENHLPWTPGTSRTLPLSSTKLTPRKSLNWGLPQREVIVQPDESEESKTEANNGGDNPNGADVRMDRERQESRVSLATDSSIQQDPLTHDASTGLTRGRQGSNRDYDDSASVSKKPKYDNEASQLARSHSDGKGSSARTTPTSSASPPSTTPDHSPDHSSGLSKESSAEPVASRAHSIPISAESSKEPTATNRSPRIQNTKTILESRAAVESSVPSRSPLISRSLQPSSAPHQSNGLTPTSVPIPGPLPILKLAPSDGIAAIAQSLAVGSAKAPPMPRPFSGQQDPLLRHGDGGSLKQAGGPFTSGAGLPQDSAGTSTSPAMLSPPMGPVRGDLGGRQVMIINKRPYTRLAQVGKGGSSKVYKVLASNSRIFALKKVSFEKADQATISGYVNEIRLLQRLTGNSRIVRLWDAEIDNTKGSLSLLMEYGEIDLAHMLFNQREQEFDIHFIGLYWRQMLEAVQVIHDEKIVHSDLKPANFLLVEGSLKLIDFGIANAIANDTTNIQREGHLGTANYMAPEAIASNPTGGGCRKLGRASDVWSLGCILYQMVYGKTPFSDIVNVFQKMSVIANPDHQIEFPRTTPSPLQPKQQPGMTAAGTGDAGTLRNPTKMGGTMNQSTLTGTVETGAGTPSGTKTYNNEVAASDTRGTAVVDPQLIRIMKGCLARQAKDRMTIPALLEDSFLHPNRR